MTALQALADLNRIRGRTFELFLTTDEGQKASIQREVAGKIEDVTAGVGLVETIEESYEVGSEQKWEASIFVAPSAT